jgi:putative addiction module killer protein
MRICGALALCLAATRAESGALGALGALTGMVLAFAGAWGLTRFVFDDPFDPAVWPTFVIAGGMLLLTMAIGLLTSRDVYRETPMAAIREAEGGARGNGDHAAVGDAVFELRIHTGPGYRVYCWREGSVTYWLLCGGNKSTQKRDIRQAKALRTLLETER